MNKILFFVIISLFLISSCAQKRGTIRESSYSSSSQKQEQVSPTPQFSVFKGASKGKAVKPEEIREEKISEKKKGFGIKEGNIESENAGFKLRDIHFDFDSYTIKPQDIPYLEKLAEWLNSHPEYKLRIEGNCDERGSELYNLALGKRRAEAAKKFLVNLGVDPDRITTVSYGEERPIDPRHCEEAWAKNRRDHFVLYK